MIASLRARLTFWYISVLASVLIAVCSTIYVLLANALYSRIDENLRTVAGIAVTSLANDLTEGQSVDDAARSTAAELVSEHVMLAIYAGRGQLLAEEGRDDDLTITLPPVDSIPRESPRLYTVSEADDQDDRHRMAVRRARIEPSGTEYVILVSTDLETTDEELQSLRQILLYVVPTAIVIAGIVGWFLARHSLSPVMHMADRARRIGVENLGGRLPVANPRDELGRLAGTFNELLERLAASFGRQRQFMADASHELRTPVATARTAATVALQQLHRTEEEYRETLEIIEQQTDRLARVVEDMFTLARADAGNYPVQRAPLYLDELIDDIARGARVLARKKNVSIEYVVPESALFIGDEDLLRRMVVNLLDNAVKHAPTGSAVRLELGQIRDGYAITVTDNGTGIPTDVQRHIFERFYRGDAARGHVASEVSGAGLGLGIARWIAKQHGGDVTLVESTGSATTFRVDLPQSNTAEP
jgi:two-component system OmpR family sensor kinase